MYDICVFNESLACTSLSLSQNINIVKTLFLAPTPSY